MNFTQLIDHLPFRFNLLRIAGFPSIVDISFEASTVKISETAGPPLIHRAGKATWQPLWSESLEIPWESSPDEAGGRIKEPLAARESKAKRASLHLRSQAVRCVSADLPEGETRVPEWIEDHADALLGIPVSPRDLSFNFKTLSAIDGGTRIKIAFARREDIRIHIESQGRAYLVKERYLLGVRFNRAPGDLTREVHDHPKEVSHDKTA